MVSSAVGNVYRCFVMDLQLEQGTLLNTLINVLHYFPQVLLQLILQGIFCLAPFLPVGYKYHPVDISDTKNIYDEVVDHL